MEKKLIIDEEYKLIAETAIDVIDGSRMELGEFNGLDLENEK